MFKNNHLSEKNTVKVSIFLSVQFEIAFAKIIGFCFKAMALVLNFLVYK